MDDRGGGARGGRDRHRRSFFLGPIAVAAVLAAVVAVAGAGLAAQWIAFIVASIASS